MELAYAFLANAAEATADGRINVLGADFDIVELAEFPTVVPLICLVARWRVSTDDAGTVHRLRIEIPGIDGSTKESTFDIPRLPAPSANAKLMIIGQIGAAKFDHAGDYRINVLLDNKEVCSLPLKVRGVDVKPIDGR
jgi:hypothetical protein